MSLVGLIENAEQGLFNRPVQLDYIPKREKEEFEKLFNESECYIPIETIMSVIVPQTLMSILDTYKDQHSHISKFHLQPERVRIQPTDADLEILNLLCSGLGLSSCEERSDLYFQKKFPNVTYGVYKRQNAVYKNYQFPLLDNDGVVEVQDKAIRRTVSISIRNSIGLDKDGNYHFSNRIILPAEIGSVVIGNCKKAIQQAHKELENYKGEEGEKESKMEIVHVNNASYLIPSSENVRQAHYVQTLNVLPIEGYAVVWRRNIMVGFKG